MFDPATLLLFVSASIALVVTPGPDLLLLTSYSSAKGIKAGIAIAVGIFAAGILQTQLVAFWLGCINAASTLGGACSKISWGTVSSLVGYWPVTNLAKVG